MTLPKLKRKARRIWKKSVKRLTFGVLKKIAVVVLFVGLNFYWLASFGQTNSYFSDTEATSVTMSAGTWGMPLVVLNEILPNPDPMILITRQIENLLN